ncbi:PGPGW domain-containing protein [Melioribacteraceae bacterium 4301-Me]|uniref:PGPGW domain-containing protein n=1 Tax=Pyranulibacter aquaticus TaxID=3163344 RepID=UPI00359A6A6F
MIIKTLKQFKKILTAIVGFTVLGIGIIMIITPGPASLVIPLGLTILASEFLWAKKVLEKLKEKVQQIKNSGYKIEK